MREIKGKKKIKSANHKIANKKIMKIREHQ